jgi:hypothetical protein
MSPTENTYVKSSIFWYITPCSELEVNRRFGRSRLHFQNRRISQAKMSLAAFSCWFACLILRPWRWRWHVPPKRRLTFNGLHGVISQKIELFITTAVRISKPTECSCFRIIFAINEHRLTCPSDGKTAFPVRSELNSYTRSGHKWSLQFRKIVGKQSGNITHSNFNTLDYNCLTFESKPAQAVAVFAATAVKKMATPL